MGFNTENMDRDLALPEHRRTLMGEMEKDLMYDENILGVFYGGSIGNGNTDLYSDIDLRIVVKDEVFEEYRFAKRRRAENWGTVLFFEDFPWANYSTAHYETFVKVDAFYYRKADVRPSVWLQNIRIIRDTDDFLQDVLKASSLLSYAPNAQEFDIWRNKFIAHVHEAYRRAMREELYYALDCLDKLRLSIVTGWHMDAGIQPNTFGDWAKVEGERSRLSEQQLDLLVKWNAGRDPEQILNVIASMVPEFLQIHRRLCGKLGMEENRERIEKILQMGL